MAETTSVEAIVGTRLRENREQAIAVASQKLGDVDGFTDGDIFDVNVYGGGTENFGIGLCFAAERDADALLEALEENEYVETVERIHYERL